MMYPTGSDSTNLLLCQICALKSAEYREDEAYDKFEVRLCCEEQNRGASAVCDLQRYLRMIANGLDLEGMVKFSALRELCKNCEKRRDEVCK